MAGAREYDPTGDIGVSAVSLIVLKTLRLVFRPQETADFGIDAQIEEVDGQGKPTGRIIGVQIKTGKSYFSGNKTHVHYYDYQHMDYWENYTAPVIIVLHDPDESRTIWQWAEKSSAVRTEAGWRIDIPRSQALEDARDVLIERAARPSLLSPSDVGRVAENIGADVKKANERRPAQALPPAKPLPDSSPDPMASLDVGELGPDALRQISVLLDEKLRPLKAVLEAGGEPETAAAHAEDPALHAKIDQLREIRNAGSPKPAHDQLEALKQSVDRQKTPHAYFRVVTNLALCALDLGREDEATTLFEEAATLEPDSGMALANLAMGRLLQKRFAEAFELSQKAIGTADAPLHTVSILLQAAARICWTGDLAELVPDRFRETDDYALGEAEYLRLMGDPTWAEKTEALLARKPESPIFRRLAAYGVIERAGQDQRFLPGGRSDVRPEQVEAAADFLRDHVERWLADDYGNKAELANEAVNASIALRLSGRLPDGIALLRRTIAKIGDEGHAVRQLGVLLHVAGDEEGAKETLTGLTSDGEAQLVLAEIVGESNPTAALQLVINLDEEIIPEQHRTTRWLLAAQFALAAKEWDRLDQAIDRVKRDPNYGQVGAVMLADKRAALGEDPEAILADLALAASTLDPDAPMLTRLAFAKGLERRGARLQASRTLDGYVDLSRDTDALRLYLDLLATSGRDREFLRIVAGFPAELRNQPWLVELEAIHAYNRGALSAAEVGFEKVKANRPTELRPVLMLAETLARRRKVDALRNLLAEDVERLKFWRPRDQLRLITMLMAFGFPERGLKLAYRLLLERRDDHEAWTTYSGHVLSYTRKPRCSLTASQVGIDCAVTLHFDGGEEETWIIEPDPALRRIDPDAREPDHDDVQRVMGLFPGARVELKGSRVGIVRRVVHKYILRMQEVLGRYNKRFPQADGILSMRFDPDIPGGLDQFLGALKERADYVTGEAKDYDDGNVLLAAFAFRIGADTIDAAAGLAETGRKFKVAVGSTEERQQALDGIAKCSAAGFVVDVQTFWTMWRLDVQEVVQAVLGRLHYSAGTLDALYARIERLEADVHDGRRTVAYRDGGVVLQETPPAQIASEVVHLEAAIAWLKANGEQLPVFVPEGLPDEIMGAVVELQAPVLDEAMIAKDRGLFLLVDDVHVRNIARQMGVDMSSWLHWVLAYAADNGLIAPARYAECSAALLRAGQTFISLSPQVFFAGLDAAPDASGAEPGRTFRSLALGLGGKSADPVSHLRVVAQLIDRFWNSPSPEPYRERATGLLLERMVAGRADYAQLIGVLEYVFRRHPDIGDYIFRWCKGHFLQAA